MKLLALVLGGLLHFSILAADSKPIFSNESIDIGMVVSDLEASAKFYTEAIGFKEVEGFSVPANWTKEVGLTDGKELKIRVFVLGEGKSPAKLKLMQPQGTPKVPKKAKRRLVNEQTGMRYMTLFVNDMDAAMARLKKAGAVPDTKGGMVGLPEGFPQDLHLTMVRDPDGNMVELVGPRGNKASAK
jgi:lactoylglutathione lyase